MMLKRKVDGYLINWKRSKDHNPLIVYGARQIGKTTSIEQLGKTYKRFVEINFIENPEYKQAFSSFNVDEILKRLSFINPQFVFEPHNTLIFFDEIQEYMDATTSLKFFKLDGRYDVICSGSALGVNTSQVSSVSVGFKDEYCMYPLDFEEFLWACGYGDDLIDYLLACMKKGEKTDDLYFQKLSDLYKDFIVLGGYPKIVASYFANSRNFSFCLDAQRKLYNDYVDDISKYLQGMDVARAQRVFKSIPSQLAKDNHKFQLRKLGHGARFNEYYGVSEWLRSSGSVILANNCALSLPLKGNEEIDNFRMYYSDTGLLLASLEEEAQNDLRKNNNFSIYNGAIYESITAAALLKQGYDLYFYRSKDSIVELDFIIRYKDEILPLEVKAKQGRALSLNAVIKGKSALIKHGVKFADANIGYANNILTLPHFLSFLLKLFLKENNLF